jgi:hypothetical protein
MAKRKRDRLTSEAQPTATNVDFPVFVPNSEGSTDIEVGRARLRFGTLVVEFKDSAPSVAIQKMIERGVLLGFGTIMLKPDVVNEMYQDVVSEEEEIAAAKAKAVEAGLLVKNEDGKFETVDPNMDLDEIVYVFRNLDKIVTEPQTQSENKEEKN